jgi:hypothetical protein
VPELVIQERPPSTLRNVEGWALWEVLELEIRERPLAGVDGDLEAFTINIKNVDGGPPGRCRS